MIADFDYDKPQLRVVWLQHTSGDGLLLATSHRICDGMSLLIIVREVLAAFYSDQELIPYDAITVDHIIGHYRPSKPWKFQLMRSFPNGALALLLLCEP
ncbi:MAG: hypothetical protein ACRD22_00855 [Terriglobia bacterium]